MGPPLRAVCLPFLGTGSGLTAMPVPAGVLANLRGPLRVIRARRFCFSVSNTEHRFWRQPARDTRKRSGGSSRNCCGNVGRVLGQRPGDLGTGCGGDQ